MSLIDTATNPATPTSVSVDNTEGSEEDLEVGLQDTDDETEDDSDTDESDGDGTPDETNAGEDADPDLETYELDGKSYKVPKDLVPRLMKDADYTQKTQHLAEMQRAVEAQKAAVEAAAAISAEVMDARVALKALDREIEAYQQINWLEWQRQDPDAAQRNRWAYDDLLQKRQQAAADLSGKEQDLQQQQRNRDIAAQRETAERLRAGHEQLRKAIPNWGPERATQLSQFAMSHGFKADEIGSLDDPRIIQFMDLAERGAAALKREAARAKAEKAQSVKPAKTVGSGGPAGRVDADKLSTAQWIERRNALKAKERMGR